MESLKQDTVLPERVVVLPCLKIEKVFANTKRIFTPRYSPSSRALIVVKACDYN